MSNSESNPFLGFDIFRKQYDEDPDNPTAEELGLTGNRTRTPMSTNIGQNVPDPATQMGELPVRPSRIKQMQGRIKRGQEPFAGESERQREMYGVSDDPEEDISDEQLRSIYQRYYGFSPEEAVAQVNELRRLNRTRQREYVPPKAMTEREAEANLQREAGLPYASESTDNAFVKALGSVIDMMEKQSTDNNQGKRSLSEATPAEVKKLRKRFQAVNEDGTPMKRGVLDFSDLADAAGLSSLPGKKKYGSSVQKQNGHKAHIPSVDRFDENPEVMEEYERRSQESLNRPPPNYPTSGESFTDSTPWLDNPTEQDYLSNPKFKRKVDHMWGRYHNPEVCPECEKKHADPTYGSWSEDNEEAARNE